MLKVYGIPHSILGLSSGAKNSWIYHTFLHTDTLKLDGMTVHPYIALLFLYTVSQGFLKRRLHYTLVQYTSSPPKLLALIVRVRVLNPEMTVKSPCPGHHTLPHHLDTFEPDISGYHSCQICSGGWEDSGGLFVCGEWGCEYAVCVTCHSRGER